MADVVSLCTHLTAKQRDVLLLMAQGVSYKTISEVTGIAVQTLYNWRSGNADFHRELSRLQEHLYAEGVSCLRGLLHEATSTLSSVMTSPTARDADRIAAARTVLQFAGSSEPAAGTGDDEQDRDFRGLAEQIADIVRKGNVG